VEAGAGAVFTGAEAAGTGTEQRDDQLKCDTRHIYIPMVERTRDTVEQSSAATTLIPSMEVWSLAKNSGTAGGGIG
jgi:hypothetical protein